MQFASSNAIVCSTIQNTFQIEAAPCRVLVMARLEGVPLTDLAAIRGVTAADPEQVLIKCGTGFSTAQLHFTCTSIP